MCSTATFRTKRRTARCGACCRSWRSTPPTAGPRLPARPWRWPTVRRAGRERAAGQEAAGRHRRAHIAPSASCSSRTAANCGCAARSTRSWWPTAASPGSASRTARRSRHRSSSLASHRISRSTACSTRMRCLPTSGSGSPHRPPRQLPADALCARRHTGIRGALRGAQ